MSISDSIQKFTSKARDTAGVISSVANFPGVPSSIRDSVNTLFGLTPGQSATTNRRDLNNFLGTVSKLNGFTRPSYFYIEILPPLVMRDRIDDTRNLAFLCESTNLPGVQLATNPIRRYGYGPEERKPYAPVFVDIMFSFFIDGKGTIQQYFYKWMNSIVKFDEMPWGQSQDAYGTTIRPFEVNFKEQYATDILITTVDESNNDIVNVRLREAFPIFLGDVNLGWADTDSISRLPVTFTYFNWKIERININQFQQAPTQSALQKLIKVGTAIQTLATLKKPNNVADIINVVNNTKIAVGNLL